MKIIDLLNKIANGEEVPKKIKWHDKVWIRDFEGAYYYYEEGADYLFMDDIGNTTWLNKEVEIIEEDKKIEKINIDEDGGDTGINGEYMPYKQFRVIAYKINEIIDVINRGDK